MINKIISWLPDAWEQPPFDPFKDKIYDIPEGNSRGMQIMRWHSSLFFLKKMDNQWFRYNQNHHDNKLPFYKWLSSFIESPAEEKEAHAWELITLINSLPRCNDLAISEFTQKHSMGGWDSDEEEASPEPCRYEPKSLIDRCEILKNKALERIALTSPETKKKIIRTTVKVSVCAVACFFLSAFFFEKKFS